MPIEREYTTEDIIVLEGLEPVRIRPGMYLGEVTEVATRSAVVTQMLELTSWTGDAERLRARVDLDAEEVILTIDAALPIESSAQGWLPQVLLGTLHGGGAGPRGTRAWCAGGVAVANAVCAWCDIEIHGGGQIYRQRFQRGRPLPPHVRGGPDLASRTRVTFALDHEIFGRDPRVDADDLKRALQDLSLSAPDLEIELRSNGARATLGSPIDAIDRLQPEHLRVLANALAHDLKAALAGRGGWRATEISSAGLSSAATERERVIEDLRTLALLQAVSGPLQPKPGVRVDVLRAIDRLEAGRIDGPRAASMARARGEGATLLHRLATSD